MNCVEGSCEVSAFQMPLRDDSDVSSPFRVADKVQIVGAPISWAQFTTSTTRSLILASALGLLCTTNRAERVEDAHLLIALEASVDSVPACAHALRFRLTARQA